MLQRFCMECSKGFVPKSRVRCKSDQWATDQVNVGEERIEDDSGEVGRGGDLSHLSDQGHVVVGVGGPGALKQIDRWEPNVECESKNLAKYNFIKATSL